MLDHHIQREIVYRLRFADSLRFSELQPEGVENKLFSYHLKKVIAARLVQKNNDGNYSLTSLGRKIGKTASKTDHHILRAYSILLLAVYDENRGWLLLRRNSHPLRGLTGFLQATPQPGVSFIETAQLSFTEQTGMTANFSVSASGFMTINKQDELESFINITLLAAKNIDGDLKRSSSDFGELIWEKNPNWQAPDMAPSLSYLVPLITEPGVSVIDVTLDTYSTSSTA